MKANPSAQDAVQTDRYADAEAVAAAGRKTSRRQKIVRQIFLQIFLLTVLLVVLFPVLWIVSMAVDPQGVARPTDLNLFPANANLEAFISLLRDPFSNVLPVYFGEMLMNSLFVALGTSIFTVVLGSAAAYAFSRFKFIGRQAGMLGFIVLLMLPSTGSMIPLYIMFSSVDISTLISEGVVALFNGLLVALLVYFVYMAVRTLGVPSLEPRWTLDPRIVAAGTVILVFIAVWLSFYALFERSELYDEVVRAPQVAAEAPLQAAKEDYIRRLESLPNRERLAARRTERAEAAAAFLAEVEDMQAKWQAMTSESELAAFLEAEIEARQGPEAPETDEDQLILEGLTEAQLALEDGGMEAAKTPLNQSVSDLEAAVAEMQEDAAAARENLAEAEAALAEAESLLNETRQVYDAVAADATAISSQAVMAVLPYIVLAAAAALVGAAAVWGVLYALRDRFEKPVTPVNALMWIMLVALTLGLGWMNLQYRLSFDPPATQTLRQTLLGLSLAFASGAMPFAVWNLKGYFDTIPRALEEAALIDGAGLIGTFFRIMVPLSMPVFAITVLFSFMTGWTEFILSWLFLTGKTQSYTLAMALATMANGSNAPPPDMQKFAAMSILISMPIMIIFFLFQRFIVGGLAIGAVKG